MNLNDQHCFLIYLFVSSILGSCWFYRIESLSVSTSLEGGENDRVSHKFFVYDWPIEVINCWPSGYSHRRRSISIEFRDNCGAGTLRNGTEGLYHTHQYSLFEIFYDRLLESSDRTLNPAEAELFFIPYDVGMDATTRKRDGAMTRTGCPKLHNIIDLLLSSPYFHQNYGHNHFFLHTINQPMVFFTNKNCITFYQLCVNCTKLSIDKYPKKFDSRLDNTVAYHSHWLSVPFPSDYHYSPTVKIPSWHFQSTIDLVREYPIAFVGSTTVSARLQRNLRRVGIIYYRLYPYLIFILTISLKKIQ